MLTSQTVKTMLKSSSNQRHGTVKLAHPVRIVTRTEWSISTPPNIFWSLTKLISQKTLICNSVEHQTVIDFNPATVHYPFPFLHRVNT